MPKPPVEYAGAPLPEVRITTNRLLSAKTTEAVLNAIDPIPNIRQINMYGQSLPKTIGNGPGKGYENNHSERQVIKVAGKDVELRCQVGDFFIEIEAHDDIDEFEATLSAIRKACDETIPEGYTVNVGRYSKYRPSLNDYRSV